MTAAGNEQDSNDDEDLHQVARAEVARISAIAGLPVPGVIVVPALGPGSPAANARFRTPRGVPTIKVTETAVRELPADALEFLLAHELGHYANDAWWTRRARLYGLGIGLGAIMFFGGLIMAATADISGFGPTPAAGWVTMGIGAIITVRGFFGFFAFNRAEEIRADLFSAHQQGQSAGAESLFAAWDDDKPEKHRSRLGRRLCLLGRTHPYRATRLAAIRAELATDDPQDTRRTR
ncbi:hypothetical protein E8P82_08940 [Arthrobacter echini]|uniref:Peptidase M48 domain-containing protein n=1 Tax=Arthrobacter echini TaxID=1529066 RepID=A0A4S5E4Y7_9MICC|nr:M48 family metalloprotease [Arthrobacter echini]THJ66565.1 hypothetical protein E8P82_08940 [Arthrobacter echini]